MRKPEYAFPFEISPGVVSRCYGDDRLAVIDGAALRLRETMGIHLIDGKFIRQIPGVYVERLSAGVWRAVAGPFLSGIVDWGEGAAKALQDELRRYAASAPA